MKFDWMTTAAIFVAIVAASLFEHMVIAPRMAHSPAKTLPSMSATPKSAADWVDQHFPNRVTI